MMIKPDKKFFSGTSGLVLTIPKRLFPPGFEHYTRLQYYATLFNSIEVNSSFYKVPMAATVTKWSASMPDEFKFTFKLWKGITHDKGLEFKPEDVDRFMQVIDHAGEKKGSLLIQFPPSTSILTILQLKKLIKRVVKLDPKRQWQIAVEFRNTSWYEEEIYNYLNRNNIGLVIHDHPSSITPMTKVNTAFVYLRFHGIKGDYRGTYSDEYLQERAQQIRAWLNDGKTVYTYFNNTIGDAIYNLQTLNEFAGK